MYRLSLYLFQMCVASLKGQKRASRFLYLKLQGSWELNASHWKCNDTLSYWAVFLGCFTSFYIILLSRFILFYVHVCLCMYLCVNGGAHGSQKSVVDALELWVVGRCLWEWFWVCWKSRGALSTEPPLQHHMTTSSMYTADESAILMWVTLTGIVLSIFHRKIHIYTDLWVWLYIYFAIDSSLFQIPGVSCLCSHHLENWKC